MHRRALSTTTNVRDATGRLLQSTDGEGYSELYAYDAWGRKTRFTNKNGAVFDYEYDRLEPAAQPHRSLGPPDPVDVYDASLDNLTVQMDANDARGVRTPLEGCTEAVVRLATVARTRIGTSTPLPGDIASERNITYNVFGEAERIRNEASRDSLQSFDKLGRLVQVRHTVDWQDNTQAQTYDAYTYDALGQQIRHVQYAGMDARPNVAPGVAPDDQVTRTDYDGLGRVVSVVSTAGFLTGYEYAATGLNGSTTTGMRRITRLPTHKTLVDDTDYFGYLTSHRD